MKKNAKKYGLMTIAAVLLVALAFAGAASAITADEWNSMTTSDQINGNETYVFTGSGIIYPKFNGTSTTVYSAETTYVPNRSITFDFTNYKGYFAGVPSASASYQGALFGNIENTSYSGAITIKNLSLTSVNVKSTGSYGFFGGIIGYFKGQDMTNSILNLMNCTLVNCSIGGTVCTARVGGLVGYAYPAINGEDCNVMHCDVASGNGATVGGLVGATPSASFTRCNLMNSTVASVSGVNVGGLVGAADSASFETCGVNNVSVYTGSNTMGGLIGRAGSVNKIGNCTVKNCVIAAGSNNLGGLIGVAANSASEIGNCHILNSTIAGINGAGGLIGYSGSAAVACSNNVVMNSAVKGGSSTALDCGNLPGSVGCTANLDENFIYNNTIKDTINISCALDSEFWHSFSYTNATNATRNPPGTKDPLTYLGTYGEVGGYGVGSAPTLTYAANGATSGVAPAKQTYAPGSTVTVLGNIGDLAKIGYDFGGWAVGSTAGEVINPGDLFTITEDVTLYANWINGPVLLTGTSAMSTYNVLVVDEVTGAVSKKHPSDLNDGGTKPVYLIESADHWNAVAIDDSFNDAVLILGDNLDFSGLSNMMTYKFTGKIYGNGYLFDGFTNTTSTTDNVGLIREAGNGLYMNYVQIVNSSLASTGSYVGTLIGKVASDSIVIGCSVYDGTVSAKDYEGGLIGQSTSVKLILNYSAVYNTTISATSHHIGGLVGSLYHCSGSVSECAVADSWIESSGSNIGGLVGNIHCSSLSPVNCTLESSTVCGGGQVGGVVGIITSGNVTYCNVKMCNITSNGGNVGGVVGLACRLNDATSAPTTVSHCNAIYSNITAGGSVGGLIGAADNSAWTVTGLNVVASNCSAQHCNVVGSATASTGGIFGTDGEGIFTDCIAGTSTENIYLSPRSGNDLNGTSATATMTRCYANITDTPFDLQFPTKEEIQVFPASKLPYVYVTYNAAPGVAGSPYSSAKQTVDMPYKRNTAFGSIVSGNSVSPVRSGFTLKGWNNAPATVRQNTEVYAIWSDNSQQYTPSSSKQTGSTVILQEGQVAPTASATAAPTVAPTVKPTEQPATPTVIATAKPTTQQTQQSPAPFVGLLAGLGAAAVLLRMRK